MHKASGKIAVLALTGVLALSGAIGTGVLEPGGQPQQAQAKTITAKGQYRFNFDKSFKKRAGCYVKKVKITKTKLTVWGSF